MSATNVILMVACISGPFLGIGIIFIIVANNMKRKAQTSQGWPTVQGVVERAYVHESTSQNEDGPDTHSYSPRVVYNYQVGGTSYQNDKYSFGASTGNQGAAQQIVARYAPGVAVSVHYNPEKPSEAVLATEAKGMNVFMVIGIIMTVIGAMIACAGGAIGLIAMLSTQ
jgi:hypothetical protein